jgi:signal transduction histidine kinase/CheY-like chemotaxis protein
MELAQAPSDVQETYNRNPSNSRLMNMSPAAVGTYNHSHRGNGSPENSRRIIRLLSESDQLSPVSRIPSPTYMRETSQSGIVRMLSISHNKDGSGPASANNHSNAASRVATVKQIRGSCDDVVGILDSLIKYDSADVGAQSLLAPYTVEEVNKLIRSTVKPFFVQAKHADVNLEFVDSFGHSEEYLAYIDKNRIAQAVRNLLSNAIRFTPADGTVCVTVSLETKMTRKCSMRRTKNKLMVRIADTGVGMSAEKLNELSHKLRSYNAVGMYESLQTHDHRSDLARPNTATSDSSTKANGTIDGGSSGLGLSISARILQEHGGSLEMTSLGSNMGCTAIFYIPVDARFADVGLAGVSHGKVAPQGDSDERISKNGRDMDPQESYSKEDGKANDRRLITGRSESMSFISYHGVTFDMFNREPPHLHAAVHNLSRTISQMPGPALASNPKAHAGRSTVNVASTRQLVTQSNPKAPSPLAAVERKPSNMAQINRMLFSTKSRASDSSPSASHLHTGFSIANITGSLGLGSHANSVGSNINSSGHGPASTDGATLPGATITQSVGGGGGGAGHSLAVEISVPSSTAHSATAAVTRRVLVVDDSKLARSMICTMLTKLGFSCDEACNGTEAVDLMSQSRALAIQQYELELANQLLKHGSGHGHYVGPANSNYQSKNSGQPSISGSRNNSKVFNKKNAGSNDQWAFAEPMSGSANHSQHSSNPKDVVSNFQRVSSDSFEARTEIRKEPIKPSGSAKPEDEVELFTVQLPPPSNTSSPSHGKSPHAKTISPGRNRSMSGSSGDTGAVAVVGTCTSISAAYGYCMILMDNVMPKMDGPTAVREIRSMGYTGPIIGVTGNTLPSDVAIFMEAGVSVVAPKPLRVQQFKQILQQFDIAL